MKFNVTDPDSGRSLVLEGDSPPTEDELNDIFSTIGQPQTPVTFPTPPDAFIGGASRTLPDLQATTRGGPRMPLASAPELFGSLAQEIQLTDPNEGVRIEGLSEAVKKAGERYIGGAGIPGVGTPIPPEQFTTTQQLASGAIQGADELAEGIAQYLTTRQGITETAAAKTPIAPAVYLKWAKDMIEGGMINAGEAYDAYKRNDWENFGKHVVGGLGMLLGGGAAAKHGVGKVGETVKAFKPGDARIAEANAKALAATIPPQLEPIKPTEVPSAIPEPSATILPVQPTPANRQALAEGVRAAEEPAAPKETIPPRASAEGSPKGDEVKPIEPTTPEQEYDAAREAFKPASRAFGKIQKAYRAREIGDAEFLAGRKAFDEAQAAFDAAEEKFIAAKNQPSPQVQTGEIPAPGETPPLVVEPTPAPPSPPKAVEAGVPPERVVIVNVKGARNLDIPGATRHGEMRFGGVKFWKIRESQLAEARAKGATLNRELSSTVIQPTSSPPPTPKPTATGEGKAVEKMQPTIKGTQAGIATEEQLLRREFLRTNPQYEKTLNKVFDYGGVAAGFEGRRNPKPRTWWVEQAVKQGDSKEMFENRGLKVTKAELDYFDFLTSKNKPTPASGEAGSVVKEKPLASDWTSATEEVPKAEPVKPSEPPPNIAEMHAGIPIPKFANRKMSALDKVTAAHSGKLQKSFSEARGAQKEIKRDVPSERRQAAISIWREAAGDIPTLQTWAAAAKGKLFKQAAIDAKTLTPKEIAIANKVISAFDVLHTRGTTFDVLKSHRDNYIPHVWDVKRPGTGFGTGMLQQRFRFSKARTFNTFFEGDQAGFKPKTLAVGKLLPAYIHEMNKVIADRQFVRDMAGQLASDGRPLVLPRGIAKQITDPSGDVTHLVFPRGFKEAKDSSGKPIDQRDYRTAEGQPALHDWRWIDKDADGNPIFMQSDLSLHPEAYRRLNAMLGQSALRQWYHEPVSGTAQVPRAIVRGLDTAQAVMKREMFGLLAPFHQVQEGTHAVGHLVNPFFGLEKVDLKNPKQLDAANHGLMLLPDRASSRAYLEGVGAKTSLVSRGIRKAGTVGRILSDVIDGYQDYLFHQYIPSLKFKTYEAMVGRNTKLYSKELASGEMTPADVKITSAEQANAAYGHLNYALLDRNPTIQHIIQLGALAPDFLEARVRFAGQGIKGLSSKVGHEQFKAIAILAAAQAGTAFVLSNLLGVPYDEKHPFEVVYKGRRYAMRSVPEDIFGLLKDTRQFIYSRVNPLIVKGGVQLATGLNYRGEKTDSLDTMTELLAGYIPITARAIPAMRSLTESGRNNPVSPLQQLAGSLGLRVSRFSPISETYRLAGEWSDKQKLPRDTGSYPVSKYQQLRYALEDADPERAELEYAELLKTMTPKKISEGFRASINHPFTGSKATDKSFSESLKGYDRHLYDHAVLKRKQILEQFNSSFK